jgi:hypothetical protein
MNINGISQNPFGTATGVANRGSTEKTDSTFAQTIEERQSADLDALKKDIYEQIGAMGGDPRVSYSIQITDKAFERMQSDPKFKADMLDIIRRELAASRPPITSSMTLIDENGYTGQSYNNGYGADILQKHEEKSFYKRSASKSSERNDEKARIEKKRYNDWLEEQMLIHSAENRKVFQEAAAKAKQEKEDLNAPEGSPFRRMQGLI